MIICDFNKFCLRTYIVSLMKMSTNKKSITWSIPKCGCYIFCKLKSMTGHSELSERYAQIPKEEPYNKANIRQSFPVKREAPPPGRVGAEWKYLLVSPDFAVAVFECESKFLFFVITVMNGFLISSCSCLDTLVPWRNMSSHCVDSEHFLYVVYIARFKFEDGMAFINRQVICLNVFKRFMCDK